MDPSIEPGLQGLLNDVWGISTAPMKLRRSPTASPKLALAEVQLCQERLERLVRIDEALGPERCKGVFLFL